MEQLNVVAGWQLDTMDVKSWRILFGTNYNILGMVVEFRIVSFCDDLCVAYRIPSEAT